MVFSMYLCSNNVSMCKVHVFIDSSHVHFKVTFNGHERCSFVRSSSFIKTLNLWKGNCIAMFCLNTFQPFPLGQMIFLSSTFELLSNHIYVSISHMSTTISYYINYCCSFNLHQHFHYFWNHAFAPSCTHTYGLPNSPKY